MKHWTTKWLREASSPGHWKRWLPTGAPVYDSVQLVNITLWFMYIWFMLLLISSKYVLFMFFLTKKHHWGPTLHQQLGRLVPLASEGCITTYYLAVSRRVSFEEQGGDGPVTSKTRLQNSLGILGCLGKMMGTWWFTTWFLGVLKNLLEIVHDKPWGPMGAHWASIVSWSTGRTDWWQTVVLPLTPDLERRTRSEQLNESSGHVWL